MPAVVLAATLTVPRVAPEVFEVLEKRYRLLDEIFKENSVAAAVLAGSFVVGIFYTVVQIVIH